MKSSIIGMCVALINFFCVILICCFSGPPPTVEKGVLRAILIIGYFITLIILNIGDNDENNRGKNDDL